MSVYCTGCCLPKQALPTDAFDNTLSSWYTSNSKSPLAKSMTNMTEKRYKCSSTPKHEIHLLLASGFKQLLSLCFHGKAPRSLAMEKKSSAACGSIAETPQGRVPEVRVGPNIPLDAASDLTFVLVVLYLWDHAGMGRKFGTLLTHLCVCPPASASALALVVKQS